MHLSQTILLLLFLASVSMAKKEIPGKKLSPEEKQARHQKHKQKVDSINAKAKGWKAKVNEKFALLDDEVFAKIQGTKVKQEKPHQSGGKHRHEYTPSKGKATTKGMKKIGHVDHETFTPISAKVSKRQTPSCEDSRFDARLQWPDCGPIINNIRDQSLCGCCWAVAAAASFTDRYCIQSVKQGNGAPSAEDDSSYFSAEDVMQCSGGCGDGTDACNGGDPATVWQWFSETGVVSGHNNTFGGCKPYPFLTTNAAFESGVQSYTYTDSCASSCDNSNYNAAYGSDKKMATDWNSLTGDGWEQAMIDALNENGTITAAMLVYDDFEHYSGGIYTVTSSNLMGGHAIRLIGYGTVSCDDGTSTDYWLGANQWNTDWGEQGYFRIRRGTNEAQIESMEVSFGTPGL